MKHLNERIGSVQKISHTFDGLQLSISNAHAALVLYAPNIVRVCISKQPLSTDFSYAVVAQPQAVEHKFSKTDTHLWLTTNDIAVAIDRNNFGISLYNSAQQIVSQDDPAFATSWIGTEVTTYKTLQQGERFIGLGEKTGNLDRRGSGYTNWNTDYFGYPANADPIYLSTPFYIGIHNGLCYGVFLDNTHRSYFNFGASNHRFSSFAADDGNMNYYLIYGNSIAQIIEGYTHLTGRMSLPPLWSLGLQQCRYSYYPDTEVLRIAQTYREKAIPADVMYLDIHYMDRYRVFTWHKQYFKQPQQLLAQLNQDGFKTVVILDPGICVANDYEVYDDGVANDVYVKYPDGEPYLADVWPGTCAFPDFTKPIARQWWGKWLQKNVDDGLMGFWNDMNEPASWGQFMPNHMEFNYDNNPTTHREARNVYGMQMSRSTYEGARQHLNGQRPFILTRAGFSGIQRYSAVWTGDNVASDEHFLVGVRLLNSLGLTGVAFSGYDVGGFVDDASPELFARWIAVGAFTPFVRCHSMVNTRSAEPWAFGEEATEIARNYINLRYRLLPYLYSTFFEATQNGMPVVRSLAINYTHDANIYQSQYQNQYLFGQFILVAPMVSNQNIAKIYLPQGKWYCLYTDQKHEGSQAHLLETPKDKLPLFVQAGAILPMQSVVQHTQQAPEPTLQLHLYANPNGQITNYTYYEDDGTTYQHQQGEFYLRQMQYNPNTQSLTIGEVSGSCASKFEQIKLYLHGFAKLKKTISINNTRATIATETYTFVNPLSSFDPLTPLGDTSKRIDNLHFVLIPNTPQTITVKW